MKKRIGNKVYDTQNAALIHKYTYGYYGDARGYEETLFQNEDGFYFLYVRGGEESIHPTEDIKRLGKDKAKLWLENH